MPELKRFTRKGLKGYASVIVGGTSIGFSKKVMVVDSNGISHWPMKNDNPDGPGFLWGYKVPDYLWDLNYKAWEYMENLDIQVMYKVYCDGLNPYPGISLNYSTNYWVKPNIGKLFVFRDIKSALDFCPSGIWRCLVINPIEGKTMLRPTKGYITEKNLSEYWEGNQIDPEYICSVHPGTMYVDAVLLLEKTKD